MVIGAGKSNAVDLGLLTTTRRILYLVSPDPEVALQLTHTHTTEELEMKGSLF